MGINSSSAVRNQKFGRLLEQKKKEIKEKQPFNSYGIDLSSPSFDTMYLELLVPKDLVTASPKTELLIM